MAARASMPVPNAAGNSAVASEPKKVSIAPLLKALCAPPPACHKVPAEDVALAFSRTFDNELSTTQLASLLTLLCSTGQDKNPDVIARCAEAMRNAASPIDLAQVRQVLGKRKRARGGYRGGLCDIVGTGGDSHSTFNISTASSIAASALLAMAKHGNRAQTSMSGSADVLKAIEPKAPVLEALTAEHLSKAYEDSNYAFLLAPNFHSGMKYAATTRRELGLRTIFNLMGPLANPVDKLIEARVIGVAYQELGPIFAQALRVTGVTKAMVVCGAEDLDEISCAGKTNCWWLKEKPNPLYRRKADENDDTSDDEENEPEFMSELESFSIEPADFGLPNHALSEVGGGKLPRENAKVLVSLLTGQLDKDHPILHFVLMNIAALLVVSGVCDSDSSDLGEVVKERGPGGGRWKEGLRLARICIEGGKAWEEFQKFVDLTNRLA